MMKIKKETERQNDDNVERQKGKMENTERQNM